MFIDHAHRDYPATLIPNTAANQSVDSLCRDGADAQYATLKQKPYNFTTNTQKPYLSIQASSLSTFVISKTHISGQKPRGRQLNAKVCDSKSAIFRLLLYFLICTHAHTKSRSNPRPNTTLIGLGTTLVLKRN